MALLNAVTRIRDCTGQGRSSCPHACRCRTAGRNPGVTRPQVRVVQHCGRVPPFVAAGQQANGQANGACTKRAAAQNRGQGFHDYGSCTMATPPAVGELANNRCLLCGPASATNTVVHEFHVLVLSNATLHGGSPRTGRGVSASHLAPRRIHATISPLKLALLFCPHLTGFHALRTHV